MSLRSRLRKLFSGKRRRRRHHGPMLESRSHGKRERMDSDLPAYPRYRARRPHWFKRFVKKTALYGGLIVGLFLAWCLVTLPSIDELDKFARAPSILVKSEDGQIVGSFGDIYGDYVGFDDLPASLIDAVLATEDRNFYYHIGIDPFGLARALIVDIKAGKIVQGGSTITQQVAKNVFLTPERSIIRKIKEMILAIKLEWRFTKQEILSIYLNRVYLGAGSYGVDAAARRYFGVPARDMTLSESAIIAGLLKAPSRFAPTSNPELARRRAQQVLLNMQDAGYLSGEQTQKAIADLGKAMENRQHSSQSALYFTDWILDQIPEYVGSVEEDLIVITTLRPDWQALAEKALTQVMDKEGETYEAAQAAILAMTPDGAVRAMIGGRSYGASQYNRATQAMRQPGSAFKPFVYLAALEAGVTPETLVDDRPITIPAVGGDWSPRNYTGKYLGTITVREALTESINTVAAQIAINVGLDRVINIAHRLGIASPIDPVPSIALGSIEVSLLELTTAYAHLAAEGNLVIPHGILEIQNTGGDVLYQRHPSRLGAVLGKNTVGQINDMLMNVIENGTGQRARIGRPAAGKTGTTSDYRDAWFVGYTPQLITGVWIGNDDNAPMKKVTGGMLPAAIWHDFMVAALAGAPVMNIPTGGGFFPSLPWQRDAGMRDYPQGGAQPWQQPTQAEQDVNLGQGFWEKLFGTPESRR